MTATRSALRRPALAAAAVLALVFAGADQLATAAPSSDAQGFVDSTARCAAPDTAVAFGRTDSSRIAICESPDGELEYRGVRVRDGANAVVRSFDPPVVHVPDGTAITQTGQGPVSVKVRRVLNDGSSWEVLKRYFTPDELLAELGGGKTLFAGHWFVAVRAP